jgi:hypothetical protein
MPSASFSQTKSSQQPCANTKVKFSLATVAITMVLLPR